MFSRILILLFATSGLVLTTAAYAADPAPSQYPCALGAATEVRKEYETTYGPCPAGLDQIENTVGNVISVIAGLGFIATMVLVVMAGFKYLTSGGEPKAIQAAHYTLTWAFLGIFFMIVAWIMLQLIASFTGINITVFDIKRLCGGTGLPFCQP